MCDHGHVLAGASLAVMLALAGCSRGGTPPTAAGSAAVTRVPVSSSAMRAVGYDKQQSVLEIELHNGDVYRYFDVPAGV